MRTPKVGPIHAASGAKLVNNPENVASGKREPEVVIPLSARSLGVVGIASPLRIKPIN